MSYHDDNYTRDDFDREQNTKPENDEQLYYHPNCESRLTLKGKTGTIGTFNQIDEPRQYNAIGEKVYPVVICEMKNLCDEETWKKLKSTEQLVLF